MSLTNCNPESGTSAISTAVAPPEDASQRKARLEGDKLEFDIAELRKPFWRRREFIGFQGSVLVGLLSVLATSFIGFCTQKEKIAEDIQQELVNQAIVDLNSNDLSVRETAGRRLVRLLDSKRDLKPLEDAYETSLRQESVRPGLQETPYLRVGAVEAVASLSFDWKQSLEARAQFLRNAMRRDRSPLVRYKAATGLLDLLPNSENDVRLMYRQESERLKSLTKQERRSEWGGSEMVYVPTVRAVVGSDKDEPSEAPAHEETIQGFWIDLKPVSVAQWQSAMKSLAPARESAASRERQEKMRARRWIVETAGQPITGVTYAQAESFCKTTGGRQLPTEVQYEVASRGESGWRFPWGMAEEPAAAQLKKGKDLKEALDRTVGLELFADYPNALSPHTEDLSTFGISGLSTSVLHWTRSKWLNGYRVSTDGAWLAFTCSDSCSLKGAASVEAKVNDFVSRFRSSRRYQKTIEANDFDDNIGFRCTLEEHGDVHLQEKK